MSSLVHFSSKSLLVGCLYVLLHFIVVQAWANSADLDVNSQISPNKKSVLPSILQVVYRIPLRVHLAKSTRTPQDFLPVFAEINEIWMSQAGICFEIQTVDNDQPLSDDGIDMWFSPYIGGLNGFYDGEFIQMSDDPVLGRAVNPARSSAARTAAHEIGHALDLPHRQDSDDNLMRSKTYGWQLNAKEVEVAREAAAFFAHEDAPELICSQPKIHKRVGGK